ncbi:MAG: outer membrane beta-barrel protein [Planctomycetia bacterium]|nr:outer membrane beta-barrel protein [Planctomycetia bacterium]
MRKSLVKTGLMFLALGVLSVPFSAMEATAAEGGQTAAPVYAAQAPEQYVSESEYVNYADAGIGAPCESCCGYGEGLFPCSAKRLGRLYVDGWIAAGANSWDEPPIVTNAQGATDSEYKAFQMNQAYLTIGREVSRGCGMSIGGRVDLLYGTDYLYTSSLGLESQNYYTTYNGLKAPASTVYAASPRWNSNSRGGYPEYGIAMPQAYGEIYVPFMAGTSIKLGHFYSPLGYESVMNPSNFFYTHSYSMLYAEAKTLTGGIVNQQLNQNWSIMAGATEAWDAWDAWNSDVTFIGGAKWENSCKTSSLAFTIMSGNNIVGSDMVSATQINNIEGKVTNYSLIFQQKLTPALQYVLQHDYGFIENGARGISPNWTVDRFDGKWYSLVNYLYYQINEKLALGGRFEWFKDENNTRVLSDYVYYDSYRWSGDNFYSATLGLNWKPTNWMTIRPEVRWDWSDAELVTDTGTYRPFGKSMDKDSIFSVGGDMIVRF